MHKLALALLLGIGASAAASAAPLLKFTYVPNEGAEMRNCTHKPIRDLPDYEVFCGDKSFTAHVIVRELNGGPQTKLELLYWVTEPGETDRAPPKFHGSSVWIRLADNKSSFASVSLAQAVENDYASLTLDWAR